METKQVESKKKEKGQARTQSTEIQSGTSVFMSVQPNKKRIIELREAWYHELEKQHTRK